MAAMPEANATAFPDSSPPTTASSASQVGVPSSRAYSRPLPMMKFDAGIGGTFSGAPGSEARPAETSHDSGLMPDGCCSILANTSSVVEEQVRREVAHQQRHRSPSGEPTTMPPRVSP